MDGANVIDDDIRLKRASGSLGCLNQYATVTAMTAPSDIVSGGDIEASDAIKGRSSVRSGSCYSITEPCSSRTAVCAGDRERSVTWAEPRIKVIPPSGGRSVLMAMHSEYTR